MFSHRRDLFGGIRRATIMRTSVDWLSPLGWRPVIRTSIFHGSIFLSSACTSTQRLKTWVTYRPPALKLNRGNRRLLLNLGSLSRGTSYLTLQRLHHPDPVVYFWRGRDLLPSSIDPARGLVLTRESLVTSSLMIERLNSQRPPRHILGRSRKTKTR